MSDLCDPLVDAVVLIYGSSSTVLVGKRRMSVVVESLILGDADKGIPAVVVVDAAVVAVVVGVAVVVVAIVVLGIALVEVSIVAVGVAVVVVGENVVDKGSDADELLTVVSKWSVGRSVGYKFLSVFKKGMTLFLFR